METLVQLQFKQRLIAAGRKTIPPVELTKRLKSLHTELAELDQERVDVHSLDSVTQDLMSPALTAHKDRGVQILTACCIADVLRLYAPEAPYDERQLHAIFDFFLAQLGHLAQPTDPHAALYFYLLESLSTVKSVVLAVDLDRPEELVTEFFRLFFEVIRPDQSRNLQLCMMDILQQLVEEAPTVPQEVVDIILAQFLKKRQTANPPAYQLACDLCNAATDRLQKYVCQYFTDVIVTASQTTTGPDSTDDAHGSHGDRLSDFKTAHYLIKELNRACPGLLLNVIPQLEEELTLDDVHLRTLATSVLGDMIAERGHALVRRYPSAWKAWIQRKNDKSHQVRGLWAELAVNLYQAQPQLGRELNESVLAKLADPEERVRSAICQALAQLDYETLAYSPLDPQIIIELGHRCRDKKPAVRQKAIQALSRMFDLAYPAIAARDPAALARFSQIPSMVLNPLYTNDAELTDAVEQSLFGTILNPTMPLDDRQRTHRLLITLSFLDARAFNAFRSILLRQAATRRDMAAFLDCCDQYNTVSGPQDDSAQETTVLTLLNQLTRRVASKLPDPGRHVQQLFNFANLHDSRTHRLIREVMELQQGYQSVTKAQRKALSRLASLSPGVAGTFTILLRRVGLSVVNSATIPPLVDVIREASQAPILPEPTANSEPATQPSALGALSQRGSQLSLADPGTAPPSTTAWTARDLVDPAHQLLDIVSTVFPGLYQQHLADLFQLL
ncbi:Sister chromatid cohesion protein pds5, partial [Dimargaris xerosporica]